MNFIGRQEQADALVTRRNDKLHSHSGRADQNPIGADGQPICCANGPWAKGDKRHQAALQNGVGADWQVGGVVAEDG